MNYDELVKKYKEKGCKLIKYGSVKELGRNFDLYKIIFDNNSKKDILITTGFHGNEFNGPISMISIIDRLKDHAKAKQINLIIYICVNPSGFELNQRYNASDQYPNNDFLRYELLDRKWVDILYPGQKFKSLKLVESPAQEVKLLQRDLKQSGFYSNPPLAAIDIHQDWEPFNGDFYLCVFNNRKIYRKIMKRVDKFAKRILNTHTYNFDEFGENLSFLTDSEGFIELHDGTISDFFDYLGTPLSLTIETVTKCPLEKVIKINQTVMEGVMDEVEKMKVKR